MFIILVGVFRVGLGENLNTWKKPRAMVHGLVVFLQSRINVKMPDVNGGWFRTSDLQRRKLVFASVAGFWGRNAGEVKFMVIWPRGFGVAHALQAKTIPILKVSVLCPDWRYAKILQCFYYSSAYTHTHTHTHTHTEWLIQCLLPCASNKVKFHWGQIFAIFLICGGR